MFENTRKILSKRFATINTPATLVVAMDNINWGVGFEGDIPWTVPSDMALFKKVTTTNKFDCKNILVCGRNTFESMGKKTLLNRHMIVISKSIKNFNDYIKDCKTNLEIDSFICNHSYYGSEVIVTKDHKKGLFVVFVKSPAEVLIAKTCIDNATNELQSKLFIIGGGQVYSTFMDGVPGIEITDAFVTRLNFLKDGESVTDKNIIHHYNSRYDTYFDYYKLKKFMHVVSTNSEIVGNGHIVEHLKRRSFISLLVENLKRDLKL